MKKLILLLSISIIGLQSIAQTGSISGKVISAETGEPLIGANILILETSNGASTDLNGRYSIEGVPVGEHDIVCKYISYESDTLRDIKVEKDEVKELDVTLRKSSMETEAIEISGKRKKDGEKHIMTMKRKSAEVVDGISAEQMSRTGSGDAASAAKRVSGVSVEGGKYVYVRGLSDRYSKTMLNGLELPGLDPNRNSVQMDLFPSNLLENMEVKKSYPADMPGDYTGGLIDLHTKDFPREFTLRYSSSISFNPQANFQSDFLTQNRKKGDHLAMGAEGRELPLAVQNRKVPDGLFSNDELLGVQTRSFSKDYVPERRTSGLDHGHSLSVGNQMDLFGNELGFVAGLSYSKNFEYYDGGERNIYELPGPNNAEEGLSEQKILEDERGKENVLWSAIADLSYKLSDHHELGALFMRNQSGIASSRNLQGRIPEDRQDPNYRFHTRTQSYRQRSIQSFQFHGEHVFSKLSDLKLEWRAARTKSRQKTPDLRYFSNTYQLSQTGNGEDPDTSYSINPSEYSVPMRFYRTMEEMNTDLRADLTLPFKVKQREAKAKFGVAKTLKDRNFQEERYNFNSYRSSYNGDPDSYFSDANMQVGDYQNGFVYMQDVSELRNNYTGEQTVNAIYGLIDFHPLKKLRVNAGARVEQTEILTESADPELPKGQIDRTDLLPSVDLTYSLKEDMNLRASYGRTIARPSFREFAPFPSFDFTGGLIRTGNADLDRSLVDNYDLRWEIFPSPGEILTVSAFAKDFHQPIERVTKPTAAHTEITWQNVDRAFLYGAELEVRKNLSFIDSSLSKFSVGSNLSLIHSEVSISEERMEELRAYDPDHPDSRDMFGQAPYIVNAFVNYENEDLGLNANINYNMTGPRMVIVSQGGTPNVYDQPNPKLDLKVSKELGEHFQVSIGAENLLNPADQWTQEFADREYIFSSFRSGRRYSLSVSYTLGGS